MNRLTLHTPHNRRIAAGEKWSVAIRLQVHRGARKLVVSAGQKLQVSVCSSVCSSVELELPAHGPAGPIEASQCINMSRVPQYDVHAAAMCFVECSPTQCSPTQTCCSPAATATSSLTHKQPAVLCCQVVFVTTEVAPWSKAGGLGDVMAALPAALAAK